MPRPLLTLTSHMFVASSGSIVRFIRIAKHKFLELSGEVQLIGTDDPGSWLLHSVRASEGEGPRVCGANLHHQNRAQESSQLHFELPYQKSPEISDSIVS